MALLRRLIPLSVVIYTVAGGLKATFTSSYLHTVCPSLCGSSPSTAAAARFTRGGIALSLSWWLRPSLCCLSSFERPCPRPTAPAFEQARLLP